MYGETNRSINEIFAEALIQIIENQMKLKEHLGIVRDIGHYGDCYDDYETINELKNIN